MKDYNATLRLPATEFPMRAGLPKREPEMLAAWEAAGLYEKVQKHNEGKPLYVLHDGPPYANGDIHLGTALNKVLKDFVLRYKNMTGFRAPYRPGWDTHGLPIESAILKKSKLDRDKMTIPEFRDKCRDFALDFVDIQRKSFKRLGVLGNWDDPYLTLTHDFEAEQIRVFGEMAAKGLIYKGLKPVYWCPHDETALAEAEVEYKDAPCESIYVKFAVCDDKGLFAGDGGLENTYFVIWTTTTWTLPGNLAICLHPELDYVLVQADGSRYVVADARREAVADVAGWQNVEVLATFKGEALNGVKTRHPFLDRESVVICGDHVTADSGTGCVHTAPGHGMEDFVVGKAYGLPVIVPVDNRGMMTAEAGSFAGQYYAKANKTIFENLKESGALLASQTIEHTYPHCWRCKDPIIFRATEQWFASVESFKEETYKAIDEVRWYPAWGQERMRSMVRDRAEWCISRQRRWGVPIPIFYCADCQEALINNETIDAVATLFAAEGSNAWYAKPASEILPQGTTCPHCGGTAFTQEQDIMDVWFDSGASHAAVLKPEKDARWPSDLYLEGADQFRGWFQSSLLTAVATRGAAPYKNVSSHGWVVDGKGMKMSKSIGNTILPDDVVAQFGADILRLWVASTDYHGDIRVSNELFKQLSEAYLKIRNTCRFILSNLADFDPDTDMLSEDELSPLDCWALSKLNVLVALSRENFEEFTYHPVFHAVHNFCVVELSSFYLDILKDTLYCEDAGGKPRRAAQTTLYLILDGLVRLLAPLLAFTSEEIWSFMPHDKSANRESVLMNDFPAVRADRSLSVEESAKWDFVMSLRADVNKRLEVARGSKTIGKSLEATVTLSASGGNRVQLEALLPELPRLLIVSQVKLADSLPGDCMGEALPDVGVDVAVAEGKKCPRCWNYTATEHEDCLCARCEAVVERLP